MKVLLREKRSGLFYAGFNQSANEAREGRDFGTVENAEKFAAKEELADYEIVLCHEDPRQDRVVPVNHKARPTQ